MLQNLFLVAGGCPSVLVWDVGSNAYVPIDCLVCSSGYLTHLTRQMKSNLCIFLITFKVNYQINLQRDTNHIKKPTEHRIMIGNQIKSILMYPIIINLSA